MYISATPRFLLNVSVVIHFGPIDGHDVEHLADVLQDLKNIPGPKILHCITQKGKGYKPNTVWCLCRT